MRGRSRRRRRRRRRRGGGVNLVTKSFEKMAEFRYSYMAVRPTIDNNVKEEIQRKLRFWECLLSFGSGF